MRDEVPTANIVTKQHRAAPNAAAMTNAGPRDG